MLARPRPVHEIPGFDEGLVSVQDAAAQLAALLLLRELDAKGPDPLRILDACAAPGGKTAHLLELADADLTALDVDPARCERIHETLGRLGLQARVVAADAAQPSAWWDGEPFDAILLDAPCTASGIVRRHPDVRWLRRESDIGRLSAVQARLLAVLWPLLKPGGRLLYCTCSVFRAEGELQAQTFVAHHNAAVLRPAPGHLMPRSAANDNAVPDNRSGDHDGFYYALFEKKGSLQPAGLGL
jgi:16S rRNA (cytosine967-C5)-methyltransferase